MLKTLKKKCTRLGKKADGEAFNPEMMEKVFDKCDLDSTAEGKPVKVSASKTVTLAGANVFLGKAVKVEKDGAVTVQLKGYVELEYTSTAPTVGYTKLISDADNKVKVDATNGRKYLVLTVDTTNKIVGFML